MMSFVLADQYVRCYFNHGVERSDSDRNQVTVEIYFTETKDIITEYPGLTNYIEKDDLVRANKFNFDEDRYTWLFSHTLLRLIISAKLGIKSVDVIFTNDKNGKPLIEGNPLFFNVSHTREAFAFVISEFVPIGIDIEKFDPNIDFRSIITTFFSPGETKYILEDSGKSIERFFLLWTRKEALLKSLGTGIINKFQDIEVFRAVNILNKESFDNNLADNYFCEHFIYSGTILNYYLSIALPRRAKIILHYLDREKVKYYLG